MSLSEPIVKCVFRRKTDIYIIYRHDTQYCHQFAYISLKQTYCYFIDICYL